MINLLTALIIVGTFFCLIVGISFICAAVKIKKYRDSEKDFYTLHNDEEENQFHFTTTTIIMFDTTILFLAKWYAITIWAILVFAIIHAIGMAIFHIIHNTDDSDEQ